MTLYSWDATDVLNDGGFIYYQNDYMYACYNDFQYYFADGTWYWNMLAWNCDQSSWPAYGNYAAYYNYFYTYYDAYMAQQWYGT
jgi:hypothetical protein